VGTAEQRLVAERFIDACASGNLETLLRTLDPDVTGVIDLGPSDPRTGQVFRGAQPVATNILRYLSRATLLVSPIADRTLVLAFLERRLWAVFSMTVEHGLVTELDGLADPEKMRLLAAQLSTASP
jgi:RNA polymerase sigma-70 factor (ECF subfamily)